jgi:hypothetical protein
MEQIRHTPVADVIRESKNPGTKTSIFVPFGTTISTAQLFRTLCGVAEKLYREAKLLPPRWPVIDWEHWQKRRTRMLCIYLDGEGVRLLPLNYELPPRVVVADSFHIKPLLISETFSTNALVLHFNRSGAILLRAGLTDEEVLERYVPSGRVLPEHWPYQLDRAKIRQFMSFLSDDLQRFATESTKFLAVSSAEHSVFQLEGFWARTKLSVLLTNDSFSSDVPRNSLAVVRLRLRREIDRINRQITLSHSPSQVLEGNKEQLKNLLERIVQRNLSKLVITAEDVQFGSELTSNDFELYRAQKNHRDDDVLDDLAELALQHGVTVQVVPKRFMPAGYKVIAS